MSSSGQKPTVAQTCNLLSQYLKGNGRFAGKGSDLSANLGFPGAETMNLLPNLGVSAEVPRQSCYVKGNGDLSAASGGSSSSFQMTMFYGGKVFVFNDFAEEKAKEIVALATLASSSSSSSSNVVQNPDLTMASASTSAGNNNNNIIGEIPVPDCFHQAGSGKTVPIARRASLHRFFEKRKDRSVARAPYPVNSPLLMATTAAEKEDQNRYSSWLEFEGHHHQPSSSLMAAAAAEKEDQNKYPSCLELEGHHQSSSSSQQLIDLNL